MDESVYYQKHKNKNNNNKTKKRNFTTLFWKITLLSICSIVQWKLFYSSVPVLLYFFFTFLPLYPIWVEVISQSINKLINLPSYQIINHSIIYNPHSYIYPSHQILLSIHQFNHQTIHTSFFVIQNSLHNILKVNERKGWIAFLTWKSWQ